MSLLYKELKKKKVFFVVAETRNEPVILYKPKYKKHEMKQKN